MRNLFLQIGALLCCLLMLPGALPAQQKKAGEISKQLPPSFVQREGGAKPAGASGSAAKAIAALTATDHMPVLWNDLLKTGKGGRMRVVLGDGSILSVGSDSQLQVKEYSERSQRSTFDLQYGKVRAQVVHLAHPDSKFEVRTATAVCGVLGTDEYIDASSPTSTLVVNLSDPSSHSQIVVRNSDSSIAGSVTLNPGEATRVDQGKPPTTPAPATPGEVSDALGSTSLANNPEVALVLQTGDAHITAGPNAAPQVQLNAGNQLTIDGRTSSGGSSAITTYAWLIAKRNFQSSEPVIELDTTNWTPGSYDGTLTITTANGATDTGRFVVLVSQPAADNRGAPAETLEGLRQAYETLQLRQFMSYFSPDYSGYSALEATLTGSFANIASNRVFLRKANGTVNGDEAVYQADFEIRFLPKTSALPQSGVPAAGTFSATPRYVPARSRATAAATGSISGDVGAVDTYITLVGLSNGLRQVTSTGTETSFSFPNLPAGQYEITPARNGFAFSPASRVVDVGATAVTGVAFTARGIEEVITESVTVTLHRANGAWLITSLSAPIGSAGLVGIPGVGQPAQGSTVPTNFGGDEVAVPHFDVSVQGALSSIARGGTSAPLSVTIVPRDGFSGNVTFDLTLPTGISAFLNGAVGVATTFTVPVSNGVPATSTLTFGAGGSASLGVNTVAFTATAGAASKQGTLASFNVYQVQITPPGDGLSIFAGGISRTLGLTISTATDVTTPLTVKMTGDGLVSNTATVNGNGVAVLTISSPGNATGPLNVVVTADGAGISASVPMVVDRKPPFTLEGPASLALVARQSSSYAVHLTLFTELKGPVIVSAPAVSGFTFTPASVTMGASGDATFTVTSNTAGNAAGSFTAAVPGYSSTVNVAFSTAAPVDFKLADVTLNLVAGQSGNAVVSVQQTSGPPAQIAVTAGPFDTGKISLSGGGAVAGSGNVTFVVQAASAASGTVAFTVTGTAGSLTRTATVTVNITGFDFALSVSPLSIVQGASTQVPVTVQENGGPAPVTVSVGGVDATRLTVSGGGTLPGAGSIALSVTALASAPPGTTSFTVTGVSGAITHTITVPVTIALPFDFSITGTSVNLDAGSAGSAAVQLSQLAGTPAPIAVALSGVDTSKISVTGGSSQVTGTSTLTYSIAVLPNAPAGPTSFAVTGQAGGLTRTATVTVNITAPKLTASASPASLTLTRGATTSVTVNVTVGTLPVTVAPGALPAGISAVTATTPTTFTSPGSATFTVASDPTSAVASAALSFSITTAAGSSVLNVPVNFTSPFSLTAQIASGQPAQIAAGGQGTQIVAPLTVQAGFSGTITLSANAPSGITVTPTSSTSFTASGQATFTVVASDGLGPGNYSIQFTATSGTNTATTTLSVAVQAAFTLAALQSSLSIPGTTTQQLGVQVTYHPNYTGSVTVSIPSIPALLSAVVVHGGSAASVTLSASGSVTFDVTAGSTAGTGSLGVLAADAGGNSQTLSVPFSVTAPPAFTVSVAADAGQPTAIAAGGQGTVLAVTVSGGSGTINVAAPTLPGWTFTPTSATALTGSGTVKFAAKVASATAPGNYLITFTAAGATSQTGSISIAVHVPFTLTSPGSSLTLAPGTTGNVQFTLTFDPNYAGTVSVTPPLASVPVASFTPSTAQTLSASGVMNFGVTGALTAGTSAFTFNASDGTGNTAAATVTISVSGGAGNGVINAGTATAAAGATAQVPVDLALAANVAIDTVQFGATVTLSGTAVPVTLTFTADPASPFGAPSLVNNQTAGRIAVFFQLPGAASPFTGSTRLGVINIPLTNATSGQSYVVTIVSANASLGSSSTVPLTPGSTGTVTVSSGRMTVLSARSAVTIDNATVSYTPVMPKAGEVVRFRVRVDNSGRDDARDSELLLLSGSRVLARQRFEVRAGRSEGVEMEWKSEEARDLRLAVVSRAGAAAPLGNANSVPLRGFAVDRTAAGATRSEVRRDRLLLQVRNESCAGIRVAAMSSTGCGGSVDLEVQPVIAMGRGIEVEAGAPNGGIAPLGVMPLASVSAAPTTGYQSRGLLQAGHSYALKTRGGYAVFRVARVSSSVNPRLLAGGTPQQQRRNRPGGGGDLLGQVFDQQTDDRLLDAARITIDIEWLIRDDGNPSFNAAPSQGPYPPAAARPRSWRGGEPGRPGPY